MHALSKAELDMLREAYRRDRNISRIARSFGLPYVDAKALLERQESESFPRVSDDGWGSPHLRQFAIQRKFISDAWEHTDRMRQARDAYDRGQVELTTGRDGDWLILYAIPRRTRAARRQIYFATPH